MRKIYLLFILLITIEVNAQIVPSSCNAPDSILDLYRTDADRLAMRRIWSLGNTDTASIVIPQAYSDTMMGALIAVYNATILPARDTVIDSFFIHTSTDVVLRMIKIRADSTLFWMQQLRQANIPTGDSAIDSLIIPYQLALIEYDSTVLYGGVNHDILLSADSNLNIKALGNSFLALPGVLWADPATIYSTYGRDIYAEVYPTNVKLTYYRGWGDCMAGCIYKHYWDFKVYYDCSVEFVGAYGDPLYPTTINDVNKSEWVLSPNPAGELLSITGFKEPFDYQIIDIAGRCIVKGHSMEGNINLKEVRTGLYYLVAQSRNTIKRGSFVKE